jgi:hypothetical protein
MGSLLLDLGMLFSVFREGYTAPGTLGVRWRKDMPALINSLGFFAYGILPKGRNLKIPEVFGGHIPPSPAFLGSIQKRRQSVPGTLCAWQIVLKAR